MTRHEYQTALFQEYSLMGGHRRKQFSLVKFLGRTALGLRGWAAPGHKSPISSITIFLTHGDAQLGGLSCLSSSLLLGEDDQRWP